VYNNTEGAGMKRVTFSIPIDLKNKLDRYHDVNWPEIAKRGIKEKLERLERFQKLEAGGEL
jgi:hypothetical protein